MDRRLTEASQRCKPLYFFMAGGGASSTAPIRSGRARRGGPSVRCWPRGLDRVAHQLRGRRPAGANRRRATGPRRSRRRDHPQNRHHYLRWREPTDGHAIAASGITWDATLGYADVAGFRLGVCHRVPLFDLAGNCPLGIEEHPLIAMDTTLSSPSYMNLDEEAAFACVCRWPTRSDGTRRVGAVVAQLLAGGNLRGVSSPAVSPHLGLSRPTLEPSDPANLKVSAPCAS